MQATRFEYRFRLWIQGLVYLLGFVAIPLLAQVTPGILEAFDITAKSTWLVLSSILARQGWLGFGAATIVLLGLALVFTGLGAWFRVWGSAYGGDGSAPVAEGPYRRTRNPQSLGTVLHTFGIALLMPPVGAVFTIVVLWVFAVRLALRDEALLAARLGQPYAAYKARVPRFLPAPTPQGAEVVPGVTPHWGLAVLAEFYFVGVFLTLAVFGWSFNATPLYRGILISLGIGIVARAFLPRAVAQTQEA